MSDEIDQHLHDLAVLMERVRALYEQYFLGIERRPPAVPRREAEKRLAYLGTLSIRNTALRFRYFNLVRRWKSHTERWDKVLREIENGTYAPQLAAQHRRERERAGGPVPESQRASATSDSPIPGMTPAELRGLHQRYIAALRSLGDGRDIPYDTLVASLARQVPQLLERNKAQALAFEVSVKDGRVVVRASSRRAGAAAGEAPSGS